MPMDGLFLAAVRHELEQRLTGGHVQKIFQPTPRSVLFHVRTPGESHLLLASAEAGVARLQRTELDQPHPPVPPAFCMLLRKHLEGSRLFGARQRGLERVVALRFERGPRGEAQVLELMVELTGRHANLVLVDADGTILGALVRMAPGEAARPLVPGARYEPPPSEGKQDPSSLSPDALPGLLPAGRSVADGLFRSLEGFSPISARRLAREAGLDAEVSAGQLDTAGWTRLMERFSAWQAALAGERFAPCLDPEADRPQERFWPFPPGADPCEPFPSAGALLDHVFGERQEADRLGKLRDPLARTVQTLLRRAQRKAEKQEAELAEGREDLEQRVVGELLTANLHRIPAGAREVEVEDYAQDPPVPRRIALDPRLSPSENAQRAFERYARAKRRLDRTGEELEHSRAEVAYLESLAFHLEAADSEETLRELAAEMERQGYRIPQGLRPEPGRAKGRGPGKGTKGAKAARGGSGRAVGSDGASHPLRYRSSEGIEILVGRNHLQNDRLTMDLARPDEWWLHARQLPGAHVLLRTTADPPPRRSLEEAALLAAHFSKARHSSHVPVDVARRRHVRKYKGARPGQVLYDPAFTLEVTPQEDRLPPPVE
ncbi:Rqc2 family fibronectin-binding protein [Limnochorda pilosa]|uniref:Rqc2 homolog RqcH n=1 Tax=Limnochorda pilosa TaxID=1555112 RepID=A0A0K2SJY2_LIMPI|nr:NFACT RNA binding domain-containing protein [Limnochorda pilosa]BAS27428.1 fibronectin-binding protein [Limnochorda pilosa]